MRTEIIINIFTIIGDPKKGKIYIECKKKIYLCKAKN